MATFKLRNQDGVTPPAVFYPGDTIYFSGVGVTPRSQFNVTVTDRRGGTVANVSGITAGEGGAGQGDVSGSFYIPSSSSVSGAMYFKYSDGGDVTNQTTFWLA